MSLSLRKSCIVLAIVVAVAFIYGLVGCSRAESEDLIMGLKDMPRP
ncbi:hypothetical protein VDG1235_3734 [Verrucomicrobiia bacterium DG1235]|nr:hypothetical protein VDG1235_3734 [Verrucomicrobiae bacterium DG1235]